MIDLRAARANPEPVRAALARKGAGDAFDRLRRGEEPVPLPPALTADERLDVVEAELTRQAEAIGETHAELTRQAEILDALLERLPPPEGDE